MDQKSFTKSFVWYESFYQSLKHAPDDMKLKLYEAVQTYGLYGELPNDPDETTEMFLNMLMPPIIAQIDANRNRRANGQKGGRGHKSDGKGAADVDNGFSSVNHRFSNDKPNVNGNVNVNQNDNVNVNQNDNVNVNQNDNGNGNQNENDYHNNHFSINENENHNHNGNGNINLFNENVNDDELPF